MTDAAELPLLPPKPSTRWRITMADQSTRSIKAPAFRVEHDPAKGAWGDCHVALASRQL